MRMRIEAAEKGKYAIEPSRDMNQWQIQWMDGGRFSDSPVHPHADTLYYG